MAQNPRFRIKEEDGAVLVEFVFEAGIMTSSPSEAGGSVFVGHRTVTLNELALVRLIDHLKASGADALLEREALAVLRKEKRDIVIGGT